MKLNGTYVFFGDPHVPYSAEILSPQITGYYCFFTEDFFSPADRSESLQQSPLFRIGGTPAFYLNENQREANTYLFEKIA